MVQRIHDTIVPSYRHFFGQYSGLPFSKKNSTKYLRIRPEALSAMIQRLFVN
jgi:hypothetical protein